ncbi:hypothetical protein EJP82_17550 [Paenibacillus anaericanus]|uniref:Uncharacterized protein n=1 Tax=Paenibacillus anaericanus TaxID=170367 RepID=A0A3S1BPI0_9BACL|nr:hypothetical protein [Paenibacillus anaericanus]RUT44424.1 hypothetical protein EJP82_17550 [Paenibacillus anaericanus]
MDEKAAERWDDIRAKGRNHFIINTGVIRWGLGTAILFSIIVTYMNKGAAGITFTDQDFLRNFIISLIIFPIGGYFWGAWMWKSQVKKYMK